MEIIIKIILSFLLGFLIGSERERNDKPAGIRSCVIVTISMTYIMLLNLKFLDMALAFDFARIPSYAIASIGFLGSGVIIFDKKTGVEGVTTASIMLGLVAIGLLVGIGEFTLASSLGFIIYFTLGFKKTKVFEKIKENTNV